MLDSVTGFVFFAHGPSFQNGVGLGSPISAPSANSQQRTNLGTLGFFLGPASSAPCATVWTNFPISPALLGRADEVIECGGIRALGLWRDNDTVEVIGLPIEFEGSTDVKSKVGGRLFQDFAGRNGYPRAIDLHLVVAIDLSP